MTLTITPDPETGDAAVVWGTSASTDIFLSAPDVTNELQWTGTATGRYIFPPVSTPFTVSIAQPAGGAITETSAPLILIPRRNRFGIWVVEVLDPTFRAALGALGSWDVTRWKLEKKRTSWVPKGGLDEIQFVGRATVRSNSNFDLFIPRVFPFGGSEIDGMQVRNTMETLASRSQTCLYRDPDGRRIYCYINAFEAAWGNAAQLRILMELRSTRAPLLPLTVAYP